jgi:hypothetical protein
MEYFDVSVPVEQFVPENVHVPHEHEPAPGVGASMISLASKPSGHAAVRSPKSAWPRGATAVARDAQSAAHVPTMLPSVVASAPPLDDDDDGASSGSPASGAGSAGKSDERVPTASIPHAAIVNAKIATERPTPSLCAPQARR